MLIEIKRQEIVKKAVEKLFQGSPHFVSAYALNPTLVFGRVINQLRVVPFDVKKILEGFYKELITSKTDNYA